jgi:hypothetical protein
MIWLAELKKATRAGDVDEINFAIPFMQIRIM